MESRNCPKIVPAGLSELWTAITPDCGVGSRRGLNQSCNPRRDLSNAMSHSQIGHREEVDSRLLVVRSQTASLTPGPSFAHNLGCRCPNDQCEAIFDIYVSRPFQWHQEHPKARCFAPCCRALNIRESRRTPNPHFFQVLGFTPTLDQVRVATGKVYSTFTNKPWCLILDKHACQVLLGCFIYLSIGDYVYQRRLHHKDCFQIQLDFI
jgi:hypothetical protein